MDLYQNPICLIAAIILAVVAAVAITLAVYFFRQKCIVSEKNRTLMRLISELGDAPEADMDTTFAADDDTSTDTDDNALFQDIDRTIRTERLYTQVNLQRQDIMDRFAISRHTLNNLMKRHNNGQTFPQYINAIRVEEARRIIDSGTSATLTAIAEAVGFTPANLRKQFWYYYGMTPTEYISKKQA